MTKLKRLIFLLFGFAFTGAGLLGALLPVLPTVLFLILALWCFARSSERFHGWLYNHDVFGPSLQTWCKYRVIPPVAKIMAIGSMVLSLCYIIFFSSSSVIIITVAAVFMALGAFYILTKPSYPPA